MTASASVDSGPKEPSKSTRWALATLLFPLAAIAIVYAPVRDFDAVWDDGHLSFTPVYRDCDVRAIFTTPANTFEYLPVRDLSLCIDHALFDTWPGGFHLQNVAIFALAVALFGLFVRRLFSSSHDHEISRRAAPLAFVSTAAFALHPLQVEPVAFITARNALLALLFLLLAICAAERNASTRSLGWYLASIVATGLALFSKATALPTALIVLLVYGYFSREATWKRVALYALPHLAITAIATVLHATIGSSQGAIGSNLSLGEVASRLPRAAFVPQFYLYKFAWPSSLSSDYVLDDVRANIAGFALGALLLAAALGAVLVRGARSRSTSAFLAAGFLLALVPVSNLLPTHPPVADRYAQIPLLFLCPLAVVLISHLASNRLLASAAAVWIATLGTLSVRQLPAWQNDETLFAHAAAIDERAVQSIENLAYTQWLRGKKDEAVETFARYDAQVPGDGQYELFLAWRAVRNGELEAAEAELDRATRESVAPYLVEIVRAELAEARGKKRASIRAYERARDAAQGRYQRDARARIYLRVANQRLRELKRR